LFEEDDVDQLTATQRSPEWFNQRQFRITGTSALALWKHFAQLGRLATDPEKELPDTFATICRVLLLKCNNREQHVADKDDVADWIFDRVELTEKSVASLKEICRLKSLPVSGTKTRLIKRILLSDGAQLDRGQHAGADMQEQFYNCF
jgi:hypothetical protein